MAHSTPTTAALQSLLFPHDALKSCLFREPSARELEFLRFLHSVWSLLTPEENRMLDRRHRRGRIGYDLFGILGIMLLKLFYRQATMRDMLCCNGVPSQATVSRLSREVMGIVRPSALHQRLVGSYAHAMDTVVGHLCIDSTIIGAREKPVKAGRPKVAPRGDGKKGRKRKGSAEEREYRERQARIERERDAYLREPYETSLSKLEMRCSLAAKQNSKGKIQWFIGYKAHLATDDFGVPMSYAVTGASVRDSTVAVPLMKKTRETTDFLYALLDKGYLSPTVNGYVDMIGRRAIIDRKAFKGVVATPLDPASQLRYAARSTVERTNSELKDGFLPDKIYKRGANARYEIELAILLTTMKKVGRVLALRGEHRSGRVS